MAENSTCAESTATQYKKWPVAYGKNWNDGVTGNMTHIIDLQFDGGVKHKDGTSWAISKLTPGFTLLDIKVVTAGIPDVTIDLGFVSFDRDCCCDPLCDKPTALLEGHDVSAPSCEPIECGPWNLNDGCMPDCCPAQKAPSCCPEDECGDLMCGLSDMVLTIHGTPPACSKLKILFTYMAGH